MGKTFESSGTPTLQNLYMAAYTLPGNYNKVQFESVSRLESADFQHTI